MAYSCTVRPEDMTILYVEDEPDIRERVGRILSTAYPDFKICTAGNGEDGLKLFREQKPDIVLTDINMPVMNGIIMALEMKKSVPAPYLIAITAYSDTQYLLDAIKIGISRYILKPVDHELLFEAVDDCVTRIRLERKVKEQNEHIRKLSRAVEQSPSSVVITDTTGTIEYVNPKFTELTGYSTEEVIGRNPRILQTGSTLPETYRSLWETITSGGEWQGQFLNRKKNGERYWEKASISPIFDEEGIITHFVAVKEDITALKEMMEHIEVLNTNLTAKARELEEINGQLEAANKELEAFNYTVSHDLRAPLANISGIAEVLNEMYRDRLDEQGREFLSHIHGEVKRMTELISALLKFSRLSRQELNKQDVDLATLSQLIISTHRVMEPKRHVVFTTVEKAVCRGDKPLLHAVMENLLDNAWKYSGKKKEAHIEFGVMQQKGKTLYFVRDDGAGFDMQKADKLFETFHRLHAPSDFAGFGIGLATVRRIIERHGGEIWAEGEVGKGATFYFTLE